jgi:HUS1 checkpoint protein
VHIRLTKKGTNAILSLTIHASSIGTQAGGFDDDDFGAGPIRETVITQDVPVVVLQAHRVEGIHEPICPEADVNIFLPPLIQLKSVSERFNRLALVNSSTGAATTGNVRLQLSANMHGCLRLGLQTDVLDINSVWDGLQHPQLDLDQMEGGEEAYAQHPTILMRNKEGEEAWASVRIDGKDWSRVLNAGRLARRVIACESPVIFIYSLTEPGFCHDHALILYVYLSNIDNPSVLTVSLQD